MLHVKRIYDAPQKKDGMIKLVDHLWPRGIKKEEAELYSWAKELAPSKELLFWFHEDKEKRFAEFTRKYKKELEDKKDIARKLFGRRKKITLVTAVKDIDHSHIPTLKVFLERLLFTHRV